MPAITFHYFDFKGLGEGIRLMMKHAKVDFTDKRYKMDEWPAHKSKMPFGQLPVLEVDGKMLTQSTAIALYIAMTNADALAPTDPWERVKAVEFVCQFADSQAKIQSVMQHKDDKAAAKKAYDEVMSTFVMPRLKTLDEHFKNSKSGFVVSKMEALPSVKDYIASTKDAPFAPFSAVGMTR